MKITEETIRACKEVDAIGFLTRVYGIEFRRVGSVYRMLQDKSVAFFPPDKNHDGIWRWKEFSKDKGGSGDVVDYLTTYLHVRFPDAITNISRYMGNPLPDQRQEIAQPPPKKMKGFEIETKELLLPARKSGKGSDTRVIAYLRERGISKEVIYACMRRKILYQDAEHGNCVFVGLDRYGIPRSASLRGTYTKPGNEPFKGVLSGSDEKHTFALIVEKKYKSDTVYVVEGAIDALSLATMMDMKKEKWERYNILSLSGVKEAPLKQFLLDFPETKNIVFGLDNDKAGQDATAKLMKNYKSSYKVTTLRLPAGIKDINDLLQSLKPDDKTQKKTSLPIKKVDRDR